MSESFKSRLIEFFNRALGLGAGTRLIDVSVQNLGAALSPFIEAYPSTYPSMHNVIPFKMASQNDPASIPDKIYIPEDIATGFFFLRIALSSSQRGGMIPPEINPLYAEAISLFETFEEMDRSVRSTTLSSETLSLLAQSKSSLDFAIQRLRDIAKDPTISPPHNLTELDTVRPAKDDDQHHFPRYTDTSRFYLEPARQLEAFKDTLDTFLKKYGFSLTAAPPAPQPKPPAAK